jgi:hypothetical protein
MPKHSALWFVTGQGADAKEGAIVCEMTETEDERDRGGNTAAAVVPVHVDPQMVVTAAQAPFVRMQTSLGELVIELYWPYAPLTCQVRDAVPVFIGVPLG